MLTASFEETMIKVNEISRTYDSDPAHNKQVANLALVFFDALSTLHHYGEEKRRLLEVASRLHDIGWARTMLKRHHKLSGKMIMQSDIPGLDKRDQMVCALVARYHTKALPDALKHAKFASLSLKNRKVVEWLAAILRVADALDSSHNCVIKRMWLKTNKKVVSVHLETNGDCWDEIRRVRRKQDLLVKKTGREIVYQC